MNNANWWANKLGNAPAAPQQRPAAPMMPPSQVPMTQMPAFQQPAQTAPSKAQSANQNATCPDCGSGNYFAASAQTSFRCYDCGYPIQQSGGKYGTLSTANVVGAAKQALGNDATNNYNPTTIIGKIG